MSYEPTIWKDGDLVTSAKLNKIEQGIAEGGNGGILIAHLTSTGPYSGILDKTWQEIHDAEVCYICNIDSNFSVKYPVIQTMGDANNNTVIALGLESLSSINLMVLVAESPNDYPILESR